MTDHTPTPWAYRPQEYDDWGFIRGPKGPDGFAPIAAIARGETSETHDAHRAAGTDPYAANAAFIVKAVNSHAALINALADIAKGEGRFSRDPFTHACNTIEDLKKIAQDALDAVSSQKEPS